MASPWSNMPIYGQKYIKWPKMSKLAQIAGNGSK